MESKNVAMLESSGEDTILVETVKNIVTQQECNELETEDFFLASSQDQGERFSGENVEETKQETKEILAWIHFCRTCANSCDNLIPIFKGEGTEHDLPSKILKYLPIHVSESDTLPLQLCHHCADTLLAWHDLSEGCLSAEKKLLKMQETLQNKQQYYSTSLDNLKVTTTPTVVSSTTNSQSDQQTDEKNKAHSTEEINNSNRSCGVRTPFKVSSDTQNAFWKPYRKRCQPRVRNLKKPENAASEDCDPICVAVMDTAHQPSVMSEQLKNNDPLRLTSKVKKEHIATERSIKDANRENKPYRTIACEMEKLQLDRISDNQMDKNLCKTSKALQKEESFLCAECGKCFRLKDSYLRHMRIHKDERPFTCHVCGKQFRDSGGLTRHLKDVHAKVKNFMCDLCGKKFASKATQEDHRRTHTGERPFVCDSCGKTFKSKASLYIHSKLHTNEFPHVCSYCTKGFRRRQEVLAHITTHTGEKNHTCDICTKKFRVKSELARHKLIHSENKPFVCIKCGLAFRQKRYLNNHIKSRHNESLRAS
ncbi:zinc finger protein 614-like isoform X2 [Nylanderia fulva]|uniref:zinc finger protein 614-like isoform X2 n=1 Tax=Nylanderia fulva TaxID=613905 RepID=UPI0010FB35DB|nr:zinc finger protein 614-like isoform X2 [Nylanderia fulva]